MPPSRGVCAACRLQSLQRPAPRLSVSSRRQYSAAARIPSISRLSASRNLPIASRSLLLSSSTSFSAFRSLHVLQSRLQSTASPSSTSINSSSPSLDQQTNNLNTAYNYTPPETLEYVPPPIPVEAKIGWLHDLGLNFGYGPTSSLQWLFEHVHVFSGFPFWGSIVATAVVCRLTMVPLIMQSSDTSSRLSAVNSITKPKMEELKMAATAQDQLKVQKIRGEIREIYRSGGIKMWKLALPMLQLPMGFALWRLTRNMADLPVPGMETGGILWFTDLTHSDPFFILPFAVALLQHLSVRTGIEGQANMSSPTMRKFMLFGLPAIAVPFIAMAPAAVQLNFTATAAIALFTNTIMRQPALRARLGLSPIVRANINNATAATAQPYKGTMTVSGRAKEHPENVRRAREQAAAAAKQVNSSLPWTQRMAPGNLVKSGTRMFRSLGEQVDKAMPTARAQQQTAAQKRSRRAADEYERKRAAELDRERADFERGRRR